MTQLTDKIREGLLGNVGTVICGRIGVTDAEIMQKVFMPTFNAEDLHNQPNYHAISTVMMFNMPSKPFTMSLLPALSEGNPDVLEGLKMYSATKYGKTRAEVEKEINARMSTETQKAIEQPESFLQSWQEKKGALDSPSGSDSLDADALKSPERAPSVSRSPEQTLMEMQGVGKAIVDDGPVFDNVVPDESVEQAGGMSAEDMALPDGGAAYAPQRSESVRPDNTAKPNQKLQDDQVIKLR